MSIQGSPIRGLVVCIALAFAGVWGGCMAEAQAAPNASLSASSHSNMEATLPGQTVTILADGRKLLLGGTGPQGVSQAQGWMIAAGTGGTRSPLGSGPRIARSGHTATLMADGRVLILGGIGQGAQVLSEAETWNPKSQQFTQPVALGLLPRSGHTATLLADGRVLVAGGNGSKNVPLTDIEIWNPATNQVDRFNARLSESRAQHQATLLPDGTVLITAGVGADGKPATGAELIDALSQRTQPISADKAHALTTNLLAHQAPALYASEPAAEAKNFDTARKLVLRFNKQMLAASLNAQTVTLLGPNGAEPVDVVPAERGVLVFASPARQLLPASRYTLFVNGASDNAGQRLPLIAIGFDTAALEGTVASAPGLPTGSYAQANSRAPAAAADSGSPSTGGVPSASVAAPVKSGVDAKSLAAMQADDELFVPTELNRKGYWLSGKSDRAQQTQPRNSKLREALYGEQERLMRLLNQKAAARGLDLKANPSASSYAVGLPVSLDGLQDSGPQMSRKLNASDASDSAGNTPQRRVRLEWSDIAQSSDLAGERRAALSAATSGTTSLAGQVLRLNGKPLANVTLSVAGMKVKTDDQGEFLLSGLPAGPQVLGIDGRSANRADAQYGVFQYRLDIKAGQANILPFVVWMPKLDMRNAVKIDSPTRAETVITNPLIPGLQVVLPKGTVIRDADGRLVTEVSITPIPVDQTPFPMPFLGVPVFYTLQPGGAVLQGVDGKPRAATLKYPNYTSYGPGESMELFDYDPQSRGWYVYSAAKVSAVDPKMIEAAQPFNVYQFTIHSVGSGGPAGGGACPSGCGGGSSGGGGGAGWGYAGGGGGGSSCGGDPVDMTTGHFVQIERDLMVQDVMPIDIRRTYRTMDSNASTTQHVRAFGVGSTHPYEIYLRIGETDVGSWHVMQLVMANGRIIPFVGPLDGTYNQPYTNVESSGEFRGASIRVIGSEFVLFFRDGRQWGFKKVEARLDWMEDRNGNRTTIQRKDVNSMGYVQRITSPNGRWVDFSYNVDNRVSRITDNIGRSFNYVYDAGQRLTEVTDPLGKKRIYTWDTINNRITHVKDPNGNTRVFNEYDTAGRVKKQTLADGSTYLFAYTTDPQGKVSQVDFTDRRGTVRRLNFDPSGNLVKNTFAMGKPEQYVETYEYTSGLGTGRIDGLGRRTQYQFDTSGNLLHITRLAGTANALTTSITYDSVFNQPLTITNPLSQQTKLTYDTKGNLIKLSDPLSNAYDITYDAQGKPLNITNPVSKTTQLAWDGGDLSSVTDALSRVMQYRTDGAGRVQSITNPMGHRTSQDWDALNRLTQITNPLGHTVKFGYDNNGFLTTQVDEKGNPTATSVYNGTGQRTSVKDALNQLETMAYDSAGQLRQRIDRKGQLYSATYDALSRTKRIGFGATAAAPTAYKSVVELTWDAANRLTQVVDKTCANSGTSLNCASVATTQTTTLSYDNLDRLIKEITPQGEVNYTYDNADRRTSMTVKNGAPGAQTSQPAVAYTWDNAGRLTHISQAAGAVNGNQAQTIVLAYDAASRRSKTTLANGSTITYTYDAADQLTALDYKKSDGALIGNLTYTYDNAGRRTSMGGSLAKADLPQTNITAASYDANNRLTQWGGKTFNYDPNGNLIADGTSTYQWDERDQLRGLSTGATSLGNFQYDAFGRRNGKTLGSVTTGFLYDGDNFIQELGGTANTSPVKAQLLTGGLDEIFLRQEGGNLQSVLADANNNTIRLLDKNQVKLVDYSYEAYGKTKADVTNGNNQQYTGRENDNPGNDNGLYYYRNRYYMPGCARFISEDPIGWASGQTNNYSYVGGDPINFNDPYGLCASYLERVWENYQRTTDILPWWIKIPGLNPLTPWTAVPVAASVGGLTWAQAQAYRGTTLIGQARAAALVTGVINGVLVMGALHAGMLIGSAVSPTVVGGGGACP